MHFAPCNSNLTVSENQALLANIFSCINAIALGISQHANNVRSQFLIELLKGLKFTRRWIATKFKSNFSRAGIQRSFAVKHRISSRMPEVFLQIISDDPVKKRGIFVKFLLVPKNKRHEKVTHLNGRCPSFLPVNIGPENDR